MFLAILILALTTQTATDLWATHALENVFPDTNAPAPRQPLSWSAARGQLADAQIVVRSGSETAITGLSCSTLKQAGGAEIQPQTFSWHFVEYQPVKQNSSKTPAEELLRKAPAEFPDALSEARQIELKPDRNQPIWVQLRVPERAAAGDYDGRITVQTAQRS